MVTTWGSGGEAWSARPARPAAGWPPLVPLCLRCPGGKSPSHGAWGLRSLGPCWTPVSTIQRSVGGGHQRHPQDGGRVRGLLGPWATHPPGLGWNRVSHTTVLSLVQRLRFWKWYGSEKGGAGLMKGELLGWPGLAWAGPDCREGLAVGPLLAAAAWRGHPPWERTPGLEPHQRQYQSKPPTAGTQGEAG